MKNPKNLGEEFKISWKNSRKSRSALKYIVQLRISGKVLEVLRNLIIRWYRLQMIKAKMVGFLLGIKVGPLEHFLEYRIFLKLLTMFKLKTQHWSSFMHEEILFQRKNSVRKIFQLFVCFRNKFYFIRWKFRSKSIIRKWRKYSSFVWWSCSVLPKWGFVFFDRKRIYAKNWNRFGRTKDCARSYNLF